MKFKLLEENLIFANSKISRNGELVTMYHSGNSEHSEIDFSKINKYDGGYFGQGMYFTDNIDYAKEYGDIVKEYYLNVENPFEFNKLDNNIIENLAEYLVKHMPNNIDNTIYYINRLSHNDLYKQLLADKKYKDLFILLLNDINAIFEGCFMDFSKQLTDYYKLNNYDGAILPIGSPFYEVLVLYKDQILKK